MTSRWGMRFADGSVYHPWNGVTAKEKAIRCILDSYAEDNRARYELVERVPGFGWLSVLNQPLKLVEDTETVTWDA